jgi:hypothetical protein
MEDHNASAYKLRREFLEQRGIFRWILIAYLLLGGAGGIIGGYLLAHEVRHWASWVLSFGILEPMGFVCLLAIAALVAPDSIAGDLFGGAMVRAKRAAIVFGLLYLGLFLALLLYSTVGYVLSLRG